MSVKKREDIQLLRGISVLAVVLFHASERILPNGYLGVDIFFVISGFVVTPLLMRLVLSKNTQNSTSVWDRLLIFFFRRFFRLAPALGITLVLATLLACVFLPPKDVGRLAGQGVLSLLVLGNFGAYHYVGDYFYPNPNALVHTWSLSVEEQIYIFIPILLAFVTRFRFANWNVQQLFLRLYIWIGSISFFQFIFLGLRFELTSNLSQDLINFNFYSPTGRLWEFIIGGLVYLLASRPFLGTISFLKKYLSLSILLFALLLPCKFGSVFGSLIVCISASVFLSINHQRTNIVNSFFIWFGDRSYSIYLIHMPLFYMAYFSPYWSDGFHRRPAKLFALGLTIIFGYVVHHFIEEKFRIRGDEPTESKDRFLKTFLLFVFVPFSILSILLYGSFGNFYGFDKNPPTPRDPGSVSVTCTNLKGSKPCFFDSTLKNKPLTLLIGDSHARHLTVGFIRAARKAGFAPVIWTQSGCQFILPKTAENPGWQKLKNSWERKQHSEKQSCFEHNRAILKWIRMHPNVHVFVTHRSTSYPEKDYEIKPDTYNQFLLSDLQKLKTKENRVTLIGPNPEFPDYKRFFMGATMLWQNAYEVTAPRNYPILEMNPNAFSDNKYLQKNVRGYDIEYIDAIPHFCHQNGLCYRSKNGIWLYTNADHLSIEGSLLLSNDIYLNLIN